MRNAPPTLRLAFLLGLLTAGVSFATACGEPASVIDDSDDDDELACVPDDAVCAGHCGDLFDGCAFIDCGDCRDDGAVNELMVDVDEAIFLWLDRGYMQDIRDIDVDALRDGARSRLQRTEGEDAALLRALWFVLEGFANGHSAVIRDDTLCRDLGGADTDRTAFGLCARVTGNETVRPDGFVVVPAPNAASDTFLSPGDVIVAWNGLRGLDLVDGVLDHPICGGPAGHDHGRTELAARTIFSVLRPGDVLTIRDLDLDERDVVVTADDERPEQGCRDLTDFVRLEMYEPGVAVMKLSRFTLFRGEPGFIDVRTEADAQQLIDNMIDRIAEALALLPPDTERIIWDARGNIGGASPVGFAIVAGMQGAFTEGPIARCTTRIAGSDPVDYFVGGPDFDLSVDDRLAVDLPATVLVDGASISAADYFPRAAQLAGIPVFGRPSAGAYGGGGNAQALSRHQHLFIAFDPFRCNDDVGSALETRGVQPDVFLNDDPRDVAEGRDTIIEAVRGRFRAGR